MKPKLLLLAALASIIGSLNHTMAYAQRPGGPDLGGAAPSADSKPTPKPRTRWQKPLQLPEQYRSKDKDKDGQIGMYEWPRNDFATFRKLDLNHDGFLTAAELTRGPSSKSASPSVASSSARSDSSSRPAVVAAATAKSDAEPAAKSADDAADEDDDADEPAALAKEKTAPATTPATTAGRSEAERQWEIVDKDKDGKVTEEEWGRSYLARPKFRDAGLAVSFPMTKEEFAQLWSQLPGK